MMITSEEFYNVARSAGISHEDWPSGVSRQLLDEFEGAKLKTSHAAAKGQFLDRVELGNHKIPISFDKVVLASLYEKELEKWRVKNLSLGLQQNPDNAKQLISDYLLKKRSRVEVFNLKASIQEIMEENERRRQNEKNLVLIPGWDNLSNAIGGFNPGRVGLLTAQTGFGKTTLANNLGLHASNAMKVLCINMEMLKQDFAERFILAGSSIDFKDWRNGTYDIQRVAKFVENFKPENIWFTDGAALSIEKIYGLALDHKRNGLDFLIVDYDQKIDLKMPRGTPEWKALQIAIQELEEIAKELEIFILVMSQSNDAGDPSGSKRSKYSASVVLNFFKDEQADKVLIKAMKNRFGKSGVCIECQYWPEKSKVIEIGFYDPPKPAQTGGLRL